MEVFNTSVGVTDDGQQRKFSVQSRRASVQCKPTLNLAQDTEGDRSMVSLTEDEAWPRCSSPTSIKTCSGYCEATDRPPDGPSVVCANSCMPRVWLLTRTPRQLSISSCQDAQRTWESKKGSFTQWLIELLRTSPAPLSRYC